MKMLKSQALVFAITMTLFYVGGCTTVNSAALAREQAVQESEQRLVQRGHELVRARSDLAHFRTTLRHLRDHESPWTRSTFAPVLVRFLNERVEPLVSNEWQSSHPELSQHDVDLRLLHAEALLDLRMKRAATRTVRRIARNYEGQEHMLVTNPLGERATLEDSLRDLNRKLKKL